MLVSVIRIHFYKQEKKNSESDTIIGKRFNLDSEVFTSKQQIYCQFLKVHI